MVIRGGVIYMNKRQAKKAAQKPRKLGKSFATAVELVRFRQNVAKANRRIEKLEKEGLEPSVLSFVKSVLGDKIRIPRGKQLTEQEYNKIKAVTERFLNAKTSKLVSAREGERKHREAFHNKVVRAFAGEIDSKIENRLYYAIGDIDIKTLLDNYVYEEVIIAMQELLDVGITPTNSLIEDVLLNNIEYVVSDELNERGVPTDSVSLRDYVDIALQSGIEEAVRQYQEDIEDETED